jgi:hypothetical protein
MELVLVDTSVKVSVVELLLAANLYAFGSHQVPVP